MEDEEMKFGPNGGLVFAMEFLMENVDWLEVGNYSDLAVQKSNAIYLIVKQASIINKIGKIMYTWV